MDRRKSQKVRMLDLLKERGDTGATNRDFIGMGIFRCGDRIKNLREDGYEIESKRVRGGLWRYTLKKQIVLSKEEVESIDREANPKVVCPECKEDQRFPYQKGFVHKYKKCRGCLYKHDVARKKK